MNIEDKDMPISTNFYENIYKIPVEKNEVVVLQMPVTSDELSQEEVDYSRDILRDVLPTGTRALIIGNDVNLYSVLPEDGITLKLKGVAR